MPSAAISWRSSGVADVEEDTEDAFRVRRQLAGLLVAEITVGKGHEVGGTEVRTIYRFGPPPGEGYSEAGGEEDLCVGLFKNGSTS